MRIFSLGVIIIVMAVMLSSAHLLQASQPKPPPRQKFPGLVKRKGTGQTSGPQKRVRVIEEEEEEEEEEKEYADNRRKPFDEYVAKPLNTDSPDAIRTRDFGNDWIVDKIQRLNNMLDLNHQLGQHDKFLYQNEIELTVKRIKVFTEILESRARAAVAAPAPARQADPVALVDELKGLIAAIKDQEENYDQESEKLKKELNDLQARREDAISRMKVLDKEIGTLTLFNSQARPIISRVSSIRDENFRKNINEKVEEVTGKSPPWLGKWR